MIHDVFLRNCNVIGFTGALKDAIGGEVFPQCVFDHWQVLSGDPRDETTECGAVVMAIRRRKGLNVRIPALENFLDKLE